VGAGLWATPAQACAATIQVVSKTSPNPEAVTFYERAYRQYGALYPALKPVFHAVADW